MSEPPCDGCRERDARIAELEDRVKDLGRYQRETAFLREEARTDRDLRLLTGESQAMKAVRVAIQQVARTDSNVLIVGETGTGKELVARAIHQLSPRRDHLMVAVNCMPCPRRSWRASCFGHEPGAFTGATRRRLGRFELAHQGTVFLDEVGELPADTQVMLLRVLQERTIEHVGGTEPVAVDVRIIAATHRDLTSAMSRAQFRPDLFFRLNVFPIHVPPLRRAPPRYRGPGAPLFVAVQPAHEQAGYTRHRCHVEIADGIRLAGQCARAREHRRASDDRHRRRLASGRPALVAIGVGRQQAARARTALADLERRTVIDALDRCHGKIYGFGRAAALLGLKPTTLYGKMRKHEIPKRGSRPPDS